jgi:hypothetical protein
MKLPGTRWGPNREFLEKALASQTDECIVWPFALQPTGYAKIGILGKSFYAHRLVCEKVYGPAPTSYQAAHSCGNKACVNPGHLSWKTSQENHKDRAAHGTMAYGEDHPEAKLTWEAIRKIRLNPDNDTQIKLAQEFEVSPSLICRVQKGKIWKTEGENKCA